MTLWKLEWLRLWRTKRWLILLVSFVPFGFLGPLTAKYLSKLIGNSAGGITVIMPPPVPADGFTNYLKNALQIGLLVAVIVAASAIAVDANAGLSVFYRTRIKKMSRLLLPRYIVATIAIAAAYVCGLLATWYETVILLGTVPAGKVFAGAGYVCLYLLFSTAVVTLVATISRSVLGVAGLALGILLLLPIIGSIHAVADWLPSTLVGSGDALFRNKQAGDYIRPAIVAILGTIMALSLAMWRLGKRELQP